MTNVTCKQYGKYWLDNEIESRKIIEEILNINNGDTLIRDACVRRKPNSIKRVQNLLHQTGHSNLKYQRGDYEFEISVQEYVVDAISVSTVKKNKGIITKKQDICTAIKTEILYRIEWPKCPYPAAYIGKTKNSAKKRDAGNGHYSNSEFVKMDELYGDHEIYEYGLSKLTSDEVLEAETALTHYYIRQGYHVLNNTSKVISKEKEEYWLRQFGLKSI